MRQLQTSTTSRLKILTCKHDSESEHVNKNKYVTRHADKSKTAKYNVATKHLDKIQTCEHESKICKQTSRYKLHDKLSFSFNEIEMN